MSETGILQAFNINELAGATGLILGAVGGILAIIFKSRCYCRLNLCYLCYCERKPPPDAVHGDDSDEENQKKKKLKDDEKDKLIAEKPVLEKPKEIINLDDQV
jgi:hypothetical protein